MPAPQAVAPVPSVSTALTIFIIGMSLCGGILVFSMKEAQITARFEMLERCSTVVCPAMGVPGPPGPPGMCR